MRAAECSGRGLLFSFRGHDAGWARQHGPSLRTRSAPQPRDMQMHASCAARHGQGVLILGPSGSGKSSLTLSMVRAGFTLVADDQVVVRDRVAHCPAALAGLLEIRGVGISRLPYLRKAQVRMVVELGETLRLPLPELHLETGLPLLRLTRYATPSHIEAALTAIPREYQ